VFRLVLAVLIASTAALGVALYRVVTDHGELELTFNDDGIRVVVERNGETVRVIDVRHHARVIDERTVVTVTDVQTPLSLTLRTGEYTVRLEEYPYLVAGRGAPVEVQPNRVVVRRGGKSTVTIKRGLLMEKRYETPMRLDDLAVSADGKFALGCGWVDGRLVAANRGVITLWDLHNDAKIGWFEAHSLPVRDLCFTRDARRFLSCSCDGTVRLWDVATRKEIRQYTGHEGEVYTARLSPDDRTILTCCQDKKLRLFDLETGAQKKVLTGHPAGVTIAAFAPDGRRALSYGWGKAVHLWDLERGQEIRSWVLDHMLHRVAWLGDGQRFLTCTMGGHILLFDVDKDQPVRSYDGHIHAVIDVTLTPDERFVVSAGQDGTVCFWDLNSGEEVLRHRTDLGGLRLRLVRGGRMLLTTGGSHTRAAHLYRLPLGLCPPLQSSHRGGGPDPASLRPGPSTSWPRLNTSQPR
jgi:WD40 repeat protein